MLHHLARERFVIDDEVPFDSIWWFVTYVPVEGESWITRFFAVETPRVSTSEVETELLTVIQLHQSVAIWTLVEVSDSYTHSVITFTAVATPLKPLGVNPQCISVRNFDVGQGRFS